jgi:hypothetical protein
MPRSGAEKAMAYQDAELKIEKPVEQDVPGREGGGDRVGTHI